MSKKIVPISESALVDLIDNIVKESVAEKLAEEKTKWIAEHKVHDKAALLEKVKVLQETVNKLLQG